MADAGRHSLDRDATEICSGLHSVADAIHPFRWGRRGVYRLDDIGLSRLDDEGRLDGDATQARGLDAAGAACESGKEVGGQGEGLGVERMANGMNEGKARRGAHERCG